MDYTVMALESSLETLKMIQLYEVTTMLEEAAFIETCLESGFIVVMEAEQKENIFKKIIDSAGEFWREVLITFKTRSVNSCKKYAKWVTDNQEAFKRRALKQSPLNLMPLWDGDWTGDPKLIKTAIDNAYNNYNNKKYDDYSWSKPLIGDVDLKEVKSGDLASYLKNKFRYNKVGELDIKQEKQTGQQLSERVDDMVKYISGYDNGPTKYANDIEVKHADSLKKLHNPDNEKAIPTTNKSNESETKDTTEVKTEQKVGKESFVRLYGRPVCETELVNMINYSVIYEANQSDNKQSTDNTQQPNPTEIQDAASDAQVQQSNEEKARVSNATKDNSSDALEYFKICDHFFKLCITAYITAAGERFKLYTNILMRIGDDTGKLPKADKSDPTKIESDDSESGDKNQKTSVQSKDKKVNNKSNPKQRLKK